jgi:thiol-disulfide isomerase/thioredoxin
MQRENTVARIRLDRSNYIESFPLQKSLSIKIPDKLMYTDGTINLFDTVQKKLLIQFPVFINTDSLHIMVHRFPTHFYSDLRNSISYSDSVENRLNLQVFINNLFFFDQYGNKSQDGIIAKTKIGSQLNRQLDLGLIAHHPDNPYSLWYLQEDFSGRKLYIKDINMMSEHFNRFNALSDSLKSSPNGKAFYSEMNLFKERYLATSVGHQIPKFWVKNFEGTEVSNQDLTELPYIIAFSATWCGPCLKSLPKLQAIYNKYRSKGLKVLYFNLHNNREDWSELISQYKLDWINVSEGTLMRNSEIAKAFNIKAIPSYILVDKEGNIVFNNQLSEEGLEELEKKIMEIL